MAPWISWGEEGWTTLTSPGPAQAKQVFMVRKRVEQIWTQGGVGPWEKTFLGWAIHGWLYRGLYYPVL